MEVTTILFTYNRPKVLQTCLHTLVNNTKVIPSSIFILDDGSEINLQKALLDLSYDLSQRYTPTHLFLAGMNRGIGFAFEEAYSIMRQSESDGVFFFCESDYWFRKSYLEDCLAVFEASPYTIGVAGTNHEDFYKSEKTDVVFPQIMKDIFGEDLMGRKYLFKDFILETNRGSVQVRGSSNSCGCMLVHWGRLKKLFKKYPNFAGVGFESLYWKTLDRAFHKNGTGDRKLASDGHMSSLISYFGDKWITWEGLDLTKNFGMLSISDFSISSHRAFGGVNGMVPGLQEGDTFVHSIGWDGKYLEVDPRS
jgi:glycosyltransferase involved in cell wall biosynthesis